MEGHTRRKWAVPESAAMSSDSFSTPVFPSLQIDYPMPTAKHDDDRKRDDEREAPIEIAISGDLSEHEADIYEKLLSVSPGGECTLYFNSPGGSAYAALSLASLIVLRGMHVTGVVLGECSSAAIWPLAACQRRIVTAHSVLLFHPLKWESGEHVDIDEAAEWARHFAHLEQDMDAVLAAARESGIPLESELGHLITVRDHRTVRLDVHRDWDTALRAAGLG